MIIQEATSSLNEGQPSPSVLALPASQPMPSVPASGSSKKARSSMPHVTTRAQLKQGARQLRSGKFV